MENLNSIHIKVIILSGKNEIKFATFGLAYALAAAAMGYQVTVFFAMEGAQFTRTDFDELTIIDNFQSIPTYITLLKEYDNVRMGICSTCVDDGTCKFNLSDPERILIKREHLRKGIEVMGMVSLLTPEMNSQTLIF